MRNNDDDMLPPPIFVAVSFIGIFIFMVYIGAKEKDRQNHTKAADEPQTKPYLEK